MTITLQQVDLHILNMRTRIPFKYGIATMTALPHIFIRVKLEVDGQARFGVVADHLPPKWFTKNPNTAFAEDINEMLLVIRSACELGQDLPPVETVFDLWREIYGLQAAWAMDEGYPPLLWGFGVSLVERAMIDAFCRATGIPFPKAVYENHLGIQLGELHPELADFRPDDFLPEQSSPSLIARHTVGLGDPLTEADIPPEERLDDGLPQSLEACIKAYGLTHFKLKLCGDAAQDIVRLKQIASVIAANRVDDYAFTLDGNEQYTDVAPFKDLWLNLTGDDTLAPFMSRLLFVEQPLHRDVALSETTKEALLAWGDRPPIIIDESDDEIDSLPIALESGYVGTSHKNCKGIFKGIANACLIAHRRHLDLAGTYIISGEDLSNVGPVALLQDSTVMATLGISHAERNSHYYFAGLSMFPEAIQEAVLEHHSDLYHRHPRGFPTLTIEGGKIAIGSLLEAPFGLAIDFDPTIFTPLDDWDVASLDE
jgi:hypothetical protein